MAGVSYFHFNNNIFYEDLTYYFICSIYFMKSDTQCYFGTLIFNKILKFDPDV